MEYLVLFSPSKLCSLAVFYCLRILLRDAEYQLVFVQENGMTGLKIVCFFLLEIFMEF
jgi:hypothetical protein